MSANKYLKAVDGTYNAEQHRTTQNNTEQHRTTQNNTEQHRTTQNNTEQHIEC